MLKTEVQRGLTQWGTTYEWWRGRATRIYDHRPFHVRHARPISHCGVTLLQTIQDYNFACTDATWSCWTSLSLGNLPSCQAYSTKTNYRTMDWSYFTSPFDKFQLWFVSKHLPSLHSDISLSGERIADLIFCLELRWKFISCSEVGTINIIYDFGSWGAFLSLGN